MSDAEFIDPLSAEVARHRQSARRLLAIGAHHKAFGELARASRLLPVSGRLAAHLVDVALRAGTEPAAITVLTAAAQTAETRERIAVLRQLARLFRRIGARERAREAISQVLKLVPKDRRARRVMQVLLEEAETSMVVEEVPAELVTDPIAARVAEADFLARGDFRALAERLRAEISETSDPAHKAERLIRLAELCEQELADLEGARAAYSEAAALTHDARAVAGAMRLALREGAEGRDRVLEQQLSRAKSAEDRAQALIARAEEALARGDSAAALADFQLADDLAPGQLPALLGLAELSGESRVSADELQEKVHAAPPSLDRARLLRRLARLTDGQLRAPEVSLWAWRELHALLPADPEARGHLLQAARSRRELPEIQRLLQEQLEKTPRGPVARLAWLELAAVIEEQGRQVEALAMLERATRLEPSHRAAFALLAEKRLAREEWRLASAALEQVALLTEDEGERRERWTQLAHLAEEQLGDRAAAADFRSRAKHKASRADLAERPTELELPAIPVLPRRLSPAALEATTGEVLPSFLREAISLLPSGPLDPADVLPPAELPPPLPPKKAAPVEPLEQEKLFSLVREEPLEPRWYRALSDFFAGLGDTARSALMAELAAALAAEPFDEPPAPSPLLTEEDRAGLRHPLLRNDAGTLLRLSGQALCALYPAERTALEPVSDATGQGAPLAREALSAAVRLIGLPVRTLALSTENGPPFAVQATPGPRLLLGRVAARRPFPKAQLRFFAARAVFTQSPELLALRSLNAEQLGRGLAVLASVVRGGRATTAESRAVREALLPSRIDELSELLGRTRGAVELSSLARGARHSANRAGLVGAGAIGPAVGALRALKVAEVELVELVRFAASERYLQLRGREV